MYSNNCFACVVGFHKANNLRGEGLEEWAGPGLYQVAINWMMMGKMICTVEQIRDYSHT